MGRGVMGARAGLLREVGEFSRTAAAMAAAAVGLRGEPARAAMRRARRESERRRWESVCADAAARLERIKRRDEQQFGDRVRLLLTQTDAHLTSEVE